MTRLLGLDFGEKRVGVAVTDPSKIISYPLQTVSSKDVISFLRQYLKENAVEKIVLGYPKNMDGSISSMCIKVDSFKNKLQNIFKEVEIVLYDERSTSKLASRDMFMYGLSKKDRHEKGNTDKISAAILLQFFMDFSYKDTEK